MSRCEHIARAVAVAVFAVLYVLMITLMCVTIEVINQPQCAGPFCPALTSAYEEAKRMVVAVFIIVALALPVGLTASLLDP